ncbi:hypothetical protein THAR02_04234 [Trichoderma harzianum]|uniref:Uncharacterized protein n=1 Tax=Trichoderma harzianum TaxID=5544 RepID=A0A0G0AF42_TRIHA|nr:hypothetical protein THAR02_04234 [Trichoderma harzianum]
MTLRIASHAAWLAPCPANPDPDSTEGRAVWSGGEKGEQARDKPSPHGAPACLRFRRRQAQGVVWLAGLTLVRPRIYPSVRYNKVQVFVFVDMQSTALGYQIQIESCLETEVRRPPCLLLDWARRCCLSLVCSAVAASLVSDSDPGDRPMARPQRGLLSGQGGPDLATLNSTGLNLIAISAIPSTIHSPQSTVHSPQFTIHNSQSTHPTAATSDASGNRRDWTGDCERHQVRFVGRCRRLAAKYMYPERAQQVTAGASSHYFPACHGKHSTTPVPGRRRTGTSTSGRTWNAQQLSTFSGSPEPKLRRHSIVSRSHYLASIGHQSIPKSSFFAFCYPESPKLQAQAFWPPLQPCNLTFSCPLVLPDLPPPPPLLTSNIPTIFFPSPSALLQPSCPLPWLSNCNSSSNHQLRGFCFRSLATPVQNFHSRPPSCQQSRLNSFGFIQYFGRA